MLGYMTDPAAPDDIVTLAEERASAREARDWRSADDLRAQIESRGWRVVDDGVDFSLSPANPPDSEREGRVIYGSVASVPSRLSDIDTGPATVVVIADGGAVPVAESLAGLAAHLPDGTQVVVVASADDEVDVVADEVIRTVEPFSPGDALQAAIQCASGAVVVCLAPDRFPTDDIVTPLVAALADPTVAVAGSEGLTSPDLRRYGPAGPGDVTALRAGCYAFRRADAAVQGPIDPRFNLAASVAAWWSMTLRDEGESVAPRRAVALELPLRDVGTKLPDDHARLARRDAYLLADRFRGRMWLASEGQEGLRVPGDGTDGHDKDDGADQTEHAS
jgi:hypothetical protein